VKTEESPSAPTGFLRRLSLAAWQISRGFLLLVPVGLALLLLYGGFGDVSYAAYIRNGGAETLTLAYSLNGGREIHMGSLAPGEVTTVGKIGGPRESPRIRVTAYDSRGAAVFCRDFTYDEYKSSGPDAPIVIRAGHLDCR